MNDRLGLTQDKLNSLISRRGENGLTAPTLETLEEDDDDLREGLENQLQGIKTRLTKVEDANGK